MAQPSIKYNHETERLETRISSDKKKLLKNAAELSGRTLTDFVVSSAYEAAVRVIQEYQQLHLTAADRDVFIQILLNPPKASNNLLKAVKGYKRDVESK
ncbi:MAG: hypothetical protein A3F46_07135 [Legionellales bacterium RIFCSPHIGHO2_12_FULL_42_9]|nr:MAG: hypothetical protein A3F46_07135 [Legionellales bacterium RIFCSPHIGHO2_12_FULL_42_9]